MGRRKRGRSPLYDPKKLDLHGLTHEQAEIAVLNFILTEDLPIGIITGNSDRMRAIVKEIVDKYNFFCYPQHWFNNGCLIISDKEI